MNSTWKWLVAGLVAAALLFAVGWWIGHRSVTVNASEVQARADSLLGAARDAYRVQAEQFAAEIAAVEARAAEHANQARQAEAGRAAADATADSLEGVTESLGEDLAAARTLADSAPILLAQRNAALSERDHARGQVEDERKTANDWKDAYDEQVRKSATMAAQRVADSTRIVQLEGLAEDLIKPPRLSFDFLGFRTTCGPGASYGTKGADIGIACVASL